MSLSVTDNNYICHNAYFNYNVTSLMCGQCRSEGVGQTSATCQNFTADGRNCTFYVTLIICGNIVTTSDPISIKLAGN